MLFNKFKSILYCAMFFLMFCFFNFKNNFVFNFSFINMISAIMTIDLTLFFSVTTFLFALMVISVVSYVCVFSGAYLESYNIKKYFFLFFLFFLSMVFLILSASPLILMTSWDYLGISSIFLVMFYPSFVSFSNSIFTMMFNRLGDVMMILGMCFLLMFFEKFYFYKSDSFLLVLMFLCSLTKSAQFPFSTWLPLAMSAPTPISAMVHSSTLVTAGVLILSKFYFYFLFFNFYMVCIFSALTFFCGGLMACFEMDLKKIVAYSTMSQISMIIFFLSFSLEMVSLSHMLFHAFFKSFLFSCCGFSFMNFFMTQNFKMISNIFSSLLMKFGFFISIFSMSGLIFSLSFFSKDFILEWFFSTFFCNYFIYIMFMFSLFTMIYCSNILQICGAKFIYTSSFLLKFFNFSFYPVLIILFSLMLSEFNFIFYSFISMLDFFLFFTIFFSYCFLNKNFLSFFNLLYFYNFFSKSIFNLLEELLLMSKFTVMGDLLFFLKSLVARSLKSVPTSMFFLYFSIMVF